MSDVIAFLESLGAAPVRTPRDYADEVARLEVQPQVGEALLRRDPAALNALLGGRAAMWCAVMSPGETPAQTPDEDSPDDAPLDEPLRDDPQPDADRA